MDQDRNSFEEEKVGKKWVIFISNIPRIKVMALDFFQDI